MVLCPCAVLAETLPPHTHSLGAPRLGWARLLTAPPPPGKPLDALCFVTHRDKALAEGRRVVQRLKGEVERQQFEIAIQAAINGKIVARERVAAYRKDVLIKSGKTVGGGDVSRKQKLLSKQREGKRRMKSVGDVQLSQEAFHAVLTDRGGPAGRRD